MPGPPPKPDDQRRRRNKPTFEWVDLPAGGRKGRIPKLPPVCDWSDETLRWWKAVWRTPQATQWDQTGSSLVVAAVLYQALLDDPKAPAAIAGALLAHEDRHGLSPKAMAALRWRIAEPDDEPEPSPRQRRPRIRLFDPEDGADAS